MVDTTTWGFSPGDRVLSIAPAGDTIYLGGSFLYIGPSTGAGVPVDARTAAPVSPYPRVVGRVYAVLADGEGGWYVAGLFTHVGSHLRKNLAHILANGSVAPWAPNPNGHVWTIALDGERLFVGGDFDSVGGAQRVRLAALSTTTEVPLSWRCDADGRVSALLVSASTLYIGGWFSTLAGVARPYVGAAGTDTGGLLTWQVSLDDRVSSLAVHDTTVYVGGYFWTVNAEPRKCLIAVGATSGALHPWNPGVDRIPGSTADGGPHVNSLIVAGDSLFVAGAFSRVGGQVRRGLAQLHRVTGLPTSWNPRPVRASTLGPEFWSMAMSGDTLFVSGAFDSLSGTAGSAGGNAGALSTSTGERFAWDPRTNDFVFALAFQRGAVYVGGWFTSVGEWVLRRGLASIDARTGRVTDWDPRPDSYVKSLLVHGGIVYVGGYFNSVGGQPRNFVAALDPITGQARPWNPGANSGVLQLAPLGGTVLAGGLFTSIGGRAQRGIAAVDTASGLANDWNPNTDGEVYSIAVGNGAVYVGGFFASMGGQPRAGLAALDPVTAAATPWNPGTDGTIEAIAVLGTTVYVGGYFSSVGGQPRSYLAAIDQQGIATAWAPNVYGPQGTIVHAIAAADSSVYVGGYFSGMSGEPREYFASLDAVTGACRTSYPKIDGPVWAIAANDGVVYVGGGFGKADSWPQICFAAIRPTRIPEPPETRELATILCAPNPVRDRAAIRYTLPANLSVSLTVFDLQGRTIAKVLKQDRQVAGPQQVSLSTAGWRPGCYLYRLDAGGLSATRKMVVIR